MMYVIAASVLLLVAVLSFGKATNGGQESGLAKFLTAMFLALVWSLGLITGLAWYM